MNAHELKSMIGSGLLAPLLTDVDAKGDLRPPVALCAASTTRWQRAIGRCNRLLHNFPMPYLPIRRRLPGYALSMVKVGVRIAGQAARPARSPLTDLKPIKAEQLAALIRTLGRQ